MKILKVKCLAPTRLDNYLMEQFPALNPGRLNKALRENKIKLNGKKQPLSTRVMAGDEIKLFILDEVLDADKRVEGPAWKNARGPAQVVYDCPQILIVNKPAGLAVDGPEDDTLLNRALLYLNQQGEYKENGSVHPGPLPPAGHRHQRSGHHRQNARGRGALPGCHQKPRCAEDLPLCHLWPPHPAGRHAGRLPAQGR